MLDSLPANELVEMRAAYETIPLDDGWRQAGTIAASQNNNWERYFAMKAEKSRVEGNRLRQPEDYIPRLTPKPKAKSVVNQAAIDITQAIIERQFT